MNEGKLMMLAAEQQGKNENRKDPLLKAVDYFKAELKNNPNSFEAQIYLAECYGRLSEPDSAIIVLNKAIESNNKGTANLFAERGVAYLNKHDYDSSTRDFENALKYDSTDNQLYRLIVHSRLSQRYYVNGTWLKFEQGDISSIINEVYPVVYKNKPSVDEFIYNVKMYTYRK
jgi:tetratricopeptide (TPR) repeat protein